jgi:hypothetical protein
MVVAEFFGGPLDGREQAIQDAPYRLVFATLKDILFGPDAPPSLSAGEWGPSWRDLYYVRRGPVLGGHVFYDYESG